MGAEFELIKGALTSATGAVALFFVLLHRGVLVLGREYSFMRELWQYERGRADRLESLGTSSVRVAERLAGQPGG